jgi:uncharacterized protein with ParB-like and HNH nuclease domain
MTHIIPDNNTIENNDDIENEKENGGLYPYDPTKEDIDIREEPQTVFELMRKYKNNRLIINPDFQRNRVWKPEQKSKFIESIILNYPLPPFYINQTKEGKYIIVDGLQRTASLYEFLNDKFELKGLEALHHLNGYNFSELITLPGDYQTRIEDKKLHFYLIKPSVPIKVIYDIFQRINTGGTILNRQEVRNCIFIGSATKLLKELSEDDCFIKAIDNSISSNRMKDREVVLRYLAFKIMDYATDYHDDMSIFVENAMRKINLMDSTEIEKLKTEFKRVMSLTFEFFGDKNFRLPSKQTRGKINIAVLESVCYFFSANNDLFLKNNKRKIKSNFKKLLKNPSYLDAVRSSTGGKTSVIKRFKVAQEILGEGCETC